MDGDAPGLFIGKGLGAVGSAAERLDYWTVGAHWTVACRANATGSRWERKASSRPLRS